MWLCNNMVLFTQDFVIEWLTLRKSSFFFQTTDNYKMLKYHKILTTILLVWWEPVWRFFSPIIIFKDVTWNPIFEINRKKPRKNEIISYENVIRFQRILRQIKLCFQILLTHSICHIAFLKNFYCLLQARKALRNHRKCKLTVNVKVLNRMNIFSHSLPHLKRRI